MHHMHRSPSASPSAYIRTPTDDGPNNRLLAMLPDEDFRRLRPALTRVPLRFKHVLQRQFEPIQFVYFPNGGVVSVTTLLAGGGMVEVALVGNEGMLGI